jgi:hypothetical protein
MNSKGCKHVIFYTESIPLYDDKTHITELADCRLKIGNEVKNIEISSELAKLGYGAGTFSNECPVSLEGKWSICPFQEN